MSNVIQFFSQMRTGVLSALSVFPFTVLPVFAFYKGIKTALSNDNKKKIKATVLFCIALSIILFDVFCLYNAYVDGLVFGGILMIMNWAMPFFIPTFAVFLVVRAILKKAGKQKRAIVVSIGIIVLLMMWIVATFIEIKYFSVLQL